MLWKLYSELSELFARAEARKAGVYNEDDDLCEQATNTIFTIFRTSIQTTRKTTICKLLTTEKNTHDGDNDEEDDEDDDDDDNDNDNDDDDDDDDDDGKGRRTRRK